MSADNDASIARSALLMDIQDIEERKARAHYGSGVLHESPAKPELAGRNVKGSPDRFARTRIFRRSI
jgi:hypothetical protein